MNLLSLVRAAVPLLVLLAVALALLALRALRRLLAVRAGTWVRVVLSGRIQELPVTVPRWRRWIGQSPKMSIRELERTLTRASIDPRVCGILLEIHDIDAGWATVTTLHAMLTKIRAKGIRIVAWLPYGAQNKSLIVATAAAELYAPLPSSVGPLGVAAHSQFYRAALKRVGVEAEVLARREYKSAAESFTADEMSSFNREQTTALVEQFYSQIVEALTAGRGLTEAQAKAFIDATPVRARHAAELGVLTATCYEDELLAKLSLPSSGADATGARGGKPAEELPLAPVMDVIRYAKLRLKTPRRWTQRGPRVGVVVVHGPIVVDAPNNDRVASVRSVVNALRAAEADSSIAAVVLSINSPGGSALASDHMAREVQRLASKKPVIAYFEDVAASGGYYIAAPAAKIVAQPSTITGSIGVVALRFVVGGALEKGSIAHSSIVRGARAEMMSPYRQWSDDERCAMEREIDGIYQDFVEIVAKGRGRTPEQIEPLARGRVYTGAAAKELGLVDAMGDLNVALALAAQSAKIAADREPVLVRATQEWIPPEITVSGAGSAIVTEALRSMGGSAAEAWGTFAMHTRNEQLFFLDGELGWDDFGG